MKKSVKKFISVACVLATLLASLSMGLVFTGAAETDGPDIWDGRTADSFADGSGDGSSADKAILIENGGQLYKAIIADGGGGKYYKLTNDIRLNDTTADDWYTKDGLFEWPCKKTFTGTFDGAGHVVYGLYSTGDERIGLFPQANGTVTIKNLGVDDAYLKGTGTGYVAGMVGFVNDNAVLSIEKSYVGEGVTITGESSGGFVAWLNSNEVSIYNCYSLASLHCTSDNDNRGAFIGSRWDYGGAKDADTNVHVKKCYGFAPNDTTIPFFTTRADYDVYEVYGTSNGEKTNAHWGYIQIRTPEQMKGADAKARMTVLDFNTIWVANPEGYPTLQVFQSVSAIAYQQLETAGTDGKPAVRFCFNLNTDAKDVEKQVTAENGSVTTPADFKNATVVYEGKEYKIDSIYAVYAYRAAVDPAALTLNNANNSNLYIKAVEITKLQKAMTDELGRPVFTVRVSVPQKSASQMIIVRPVLKLVDPATNDTFEAPCGYIEGAAA